MELLKVDSLCLCWWPKRSSNGLCEWLIALWLWGNFASLSPAENCTLLTPGNKALPLGRWGEGHLCFSASYFHISTVEKYFFCYLNVSKISTVDCGIGHVSIYSPGDQWHILVVCQTLQNMLCNVLYDYVVVDCLPIGWTRWSQTISQSRLPQKQWHLALHIVKITHNSFVCTKLYIVRFVLFVWCMHGRYIAESQDPPTFASHSDVDVVNNSF